MAQNFWLFKSEPTTFSWQDLLKVKRTAWEGVRNYQARNFLRDSIKKDDGVLFYHSSCTPQSVMGVARVVKEGYPDPMQFDESSKYFDDKADPKNPRWFMVDIKAEKSFATPVTLAQLRETPGLEEMPLLQKGMRLSVQPVSAAEWRIVTRLGGLTIGL